MLSDTLTFSPFDPKEDSPEIFRLSSPMMRSLSDSLSVSGHLRYTAQWSQWSCWDGRRWATDGTLSVFDKSTRDMPTGCHAL